MLDGLSIDLLLRVLIAAILGGVIGTERGIGDRPAGMRTHVLVCTGSTVLMLVSMHGSDGVDGSFDPMRIAAQVVSGIGFLGAGTIVHEGVNVKGLTTAASLWMVSGIGLAVGCGMLQLAILATFVTMLTLVTLHKVEKRFMTAEQNEQRYLKITAKDTFNSITDIINFLHDKGIKIKNTKIKNSNLYKNVTVELTLKGSKNRNLDEIITELNDSDQVLSIEQSLRDVTIK
jgi:putative Mg2+ transporter-C (MgtC) family protein